jgi:hypothetical protein
VDLSFRFVEFLPSAPLRPIDGLDVQVPYDLTCLAGLSDTLATLERYLLGICRHQSVFAVAFRHSQLHRVLIYPPPQSYVSTHLSPLTLGCLRLNRRIVGTGESHETDK